MEMIRYQMTTMIGNYPHHHQTMIWSHLDEEAWTFIQTMEDKKALRWPEDHLVLFWSRWWSDTRWWTSPPDEGARKPRWPDDHLVPSWSRGHCHLGAAPSLIIRSLSIGRSAFAIHYNLLMLIIAHYLNPPSFVRWLLYIFSGNKIDQNCEEDVEGQKWFITGSCFVDHWLLIFWWLMNRMKMKIICVRHQRWLRFISRLCPTDHCTLAQTIALPSSFLKQLLIGGCLGTDQWLEMIKTDSFISGSSDFAFDDRSIFLLFDHQISQFG